MNDTETITVLCELKSGNSVCIQYSENIGFRANGIPLKEIEIRGIYVPLLEELKVTDLNDPSKETVTKKVSLTCITPTAFKKYISLAFV